MSEVAHWKLNEQSGTSIADSAGSNTGTWQGTELVSNGGFANWNGVANPNNKPDNWSIGGSLALPDRFFNDLTNACQALSDGAAITLTSDLVLVVGKSYTLSINITRTIRGSLVISDGTAIIVTYTVASSGVQTISFVATDTSLIISTSGNTDMGFTNVSVQGQVDSRKGIIDTALLFDGDITGPNGDKIEIADSSSLDVLAITVSAWVNLSEPFQDENVIFSKQNDIAGGSEEFSYMMAITELGGLRRLRMWISDTGNITSSENSVPAIPVSGWSHVVYTYEFVDSTAIYKMYINGENIATNGGGNASGTIYQGTGRVTIGARSGDSGTTHSEFFNGLIDNVIIYDHALSASEVLQLYQDGAVPFSRSRYSGNSAVRLPRRRFSPNSSF